MRVLPVDRRVRWEGELLALAVVLVPVAIAASGGVDSPLLVVPLFTLVCCAFVYDGRAATMATGLITLLNFAPLAYDSRATDAKALGSAIALGVVLVGVAAVIVACRNELVRVGDRARAEALRDPLTELSNRRALMEMLARHAHGRRLGDSVGVLLVDLDGLKRINTLHGHGGGDAAILAAAQALRDTARDGDMVARLGGDEFAIVTPRIDRGGLVRLGERALAAVAAASATIGLDDVVLAASAGAALLPDDADSVDGVLKAADGALGVAKRVGKGRVVAADDRTLVALV